jgi:hypothetical protein
MHNSAVARFARTLAVTFRAGVPLVEALETVAGATGNMVYERGHACGSRTTLPSGYQLNVAMRQVNLFPHMVIQMTAIGEEAGALDTMLIKVAEFYEQEVNNAVDALSSLIEPFIMVFIGVAGRRHGHRHVPADLQASGDDLNASNRSTSELLITYPALADRQRRRLLGALVGSFLNVVILRLPLRMQWQWERDSREVLGPGGDLRCRRERGGTPRAARHRGGTLPLPEMRPQARAVGKPSRA